jgi:multidrug transporter EmrE-like cation transporter
MIYLLVLFGMALNVAAQVALKYASAKPAGAEISDDTFSVLADPVRLATNPWFIFGLVLYAVSVINWVVVLGKIQLSVAYPLMSIGYIFTLILGAWLFKEPVSLTRIAGVLVIIFGVVLITRPVPHV